MKRGFRPETKHIPLMIGSVFGEFTSFAPISWDRENLSDEEQVLLVRKTWGTDVADRLIPLFRRAYPERKTADLLLTDFIFRAPEIRYIAERSRLNRCTWSYLFNMDQPIDGGNTPWHCCDIPYVFHNIDLVEYPWGPGTEKTAEKVQEEAFRSVMAFAASGNPNNETVPAWPASRPGSENVLVLDGNTRVLENYDHELIQGLESCAEEITRKMFASAGPIQH